MSVAKPNQMAQPKARLSVAKPNVAERHPFGGPLSKSFDTDQSNSSYGSLAKFIIENGHPTGWEKFFDREDVLDVLESISDKILLEEEIIYPPIENVFRIFESLKLDDIKVILLGQDPYFDGTTATDGSATGFAFSVRKGNKVNPSLRNIYKELKNEGYTPTEDGDLEPYVKQGMFLLNTALTVRRGRSESHLYWWAPFTIKLVEYISSQSTGKVWMLLGGKAQMYEKHIKNPEKHHIIKSSHPSPLGCNSGSARSPAFMGSGIFRAVDECLGDNKIVW